jgi:hypothetical protein
MAPPALSLDESSQTYIIASNIIDNSAKRSTSSPIQTRKEVLESENADEDSDFIEELCSPPRELIKRSPSRNKQCRIADSENAAPPKCGREISVRESKSNDKVVSHPAVVNEERNEPIRDGLYFSRNPRKVNYRYYGGLFCT